MQLPADFVGSVTLATSIGRKDKILVPILTIIRYTFDSTENSGYLSRTLQLSRTLHFHVLIQDISSTFLF